MVSSKGERLRGKLNLVEMLGALKGQRLGHVDGSPVTESIYTHVISEDGSVWLHSSAMPCGEFWTELDPERKTAREWSLLSRLVLTKNWLRGSDLN